MKLVPQGSPMPQALWVDTFLMQSGHQLAGQQADCEDVVSHLAEGVVGLERWSA